MIEVERKLGQFHLHVNIKITHKNVQLRPVHVSHSHTSSAVIPKNGEVVSGRSWHLRVILGWCEVTDDEQHDGVRLMVLLVHIVDRFESVQNRGGRMACTETGETGFKLPGK